MAWSIKDYGADTMVAWAKSLLTKIGAPLSPGNVQFVYDWEVSEGGGGAYNPLNEGPDPAHPDYSGGSQYGGGASDYTSWATGLQGAADYLGMPNYAGVKAGLVSNQPSSARTALIASPWASGHYSGDGGAPGSAFNTSAVPGTSSALSDQISAGMAAGGTGSTVQTVGSVTGAASSVLGGLSHLLGIPTASDVEKGAAKIAIESILLLGGVGLVVLGAWRTVSPSVQKVESRVQTSAEKPVQAAAAVAPAAAAAA